MRTFYRTGALLALVAFAVVCRSDPAQAQRSGDGFLFSRPDAVLNIYGGLSRPNANSELFDFVTDILSLDKGDFLGGAVGGALWFPLSSRVDLDVSANIQARLAESDYRYLEGDDDLPIEQETFFARVPLLIGARYYVTPRERTIGSLVWIPSDYAVYVGGAAGAMWYQFTQSGEFVDFEDDTIFRDELESRGWSPAAQLKAGVEYSVGPRVGINAEAGYLWGRADLGRDYSDFDAIDLSGFSALFGVFLRL